METRFLHTAQPAADEPKYASTEEGRTDSRVFFWRCGWNDAVNRFRTLLAAPAAAVDARDAEPMFYVQDTRQFVGNCVMWWGKNCSGYVTRLNEAGKYPLDEASRICERDTDRMWPCEQIDAPAHPTVDMQHLPKPLQYRTKCAGVAHSLNKKDYA
ncbi:hypothetical protein [Cupriavidus sp. 8B]